MMKKLNSLIGAALIAASGMLAGSAYAAGGGEHSGPEAKLIDWTFGGVFGTYDKAQLQRGFQVFQEVCSACHGAELFSFRMLEKEGGPEYSEAQVKALAASYTIQDPEHIDGERSGVPADKWPSPFETVQDAKDANGGVMPPDFSVLAKARNVPQKFPNWIGNYFTAYQEGGADYIYNLLTGYNDAPEGVEVGAGQYWNDHFHGTGGTLAMAPPLFDEMVDYEGEAPETVDQYAKDIAAFMMWLAEPDMTSRKALGFNVLMFLFLFAGMMYMVKRKLWSSVDH
ncbi:cytochrome c1 [Maritalea mobilis]|nr:cytochrome c1 [Maritalea mobilis]